MAKCYNASFLTLKNMSFLKSKPIKVLLEILKTLIIFLLIYAVLNWWRQPTIAQSPVLTLTDTNGQSHDLTALSQNKLILVYFWATWCHICKHTTPSVLSLADTHPVMAVAVNSGDDRVVSQFLNQYQKPPQFYLVNDEHGAYFNTWQGQVTPSFVIIKDGQVVQSFVGLQPSWVLRVRMAVANL